MAARKPKRSATVLEPTQMDPSDVSETMAQITSERPPVEGEHTILFRWPGPGLFTEPLDGVTIRHCPPCKRVSLPERCARAAVEAGFQFVRWASQ